MLLLLIRCKHTPTFEPFMAGWFDIDRRIRVALMHTHTDTKLRGFYGAGVNLPTVEFPPVNICC